MFFVVQIFSSFERQRYVGHVINLPRMFCFTNLFCQIWADPISTTVVKAPAATAPPSDPTILLMWPPAGLGGPQDRTLYDQDRTLYDWDRTLYD